MGSGVTMTGWEKVFPRSWECVTTMRSTIGRTSHSVPSGPKAGAAVKGCGAPAARPSSSAARQITSLRILSFLSEPRPEADDDCERHPQGGDGGGADGSALERRRGVAHGQVLEVRKVLHAGIDVHRLRRRIGRTDVDDRGTLVQLGMARVVPVSRERPQGRGEGQLRE